MAKSGPIVVIEDDIDDQEIVAEILNDIGIKNEVIFFDECSGAWTFLKTTTKPIFLILCDINLPKVSGLEFKMKVDSDAQLRHKSIPFIFLSTAASKQIVTEAFTKMTVQGFFQKTNSMGELKHALTIVMEYWKLCKHPNSDF